MSGNTRHERIVLEVVAGFCGWIWIASGSVSIVFALLAVFSRFSWWNVLYAVMMSGLAKWVGRGFSDDQRRVAFEADSIAKGMSPKKSP